jgi:aspartate/methionine/tyrosine aminotransferase
MMAPVFSSRTRWSRSPNRLAEALAAHAARGAALLDLTEANPTRVGLMPPPELLAPLGAAAAQPYAPVAQGLPETRAAIAADYARRGFAVRPEQIVVTASTSEAYGYLLKLLCDPGDAILIPRPSYPLFEFLVGLESVQAHNYPLRYDGEWHVDLGALAETFTQRTRALMLVNPNNPTGSYLKHDERAAIAALCEPRAVALVSDEVFADYPLRADPRQCRSVADATTGLAFALGGLSKACLAPHLKLGWICVAGQADLRDEALARLEVMADTYLSVATPIQRLTPSLLGHIDRLQAPVAARTQQNLEFLRERIGGAVSLLRPEAGWYAVLRVPAVRDEEDLVLELLEQHGVLVHPGYFFDFPDPAYIVLSLLPPPAQFQQAVARLLRVL